MSVLRRALQIVKAKVPVTSKLGHLRSMQAGPPQQTPSDHGPTPATIDEADTR